MLKGRKILLGVTGSIAAYKIAFLTRLFIQKGADVRIIMTPSASDFISPLTLSTLSQNKVHTELSTSAEWNNHVELGMWADLFIIAPATAHTMAKARTGLADNILLATYLSAKCPVWFAPAMDLDMWKHPSTKENIARLKEYGHHILQVGKGFLASGLEGEGRMAEPLEILEEVKKYFREQEEEQTLNGQKILITAGPTYEAIDPVRFIGNHSSGKMGMALSNAALKKGAEVHLVLGPTSIEIPQHNHLHIYRVTSAGQMLEECSRLFPDMNGAIFAAAVADYKATKPSGQKIKKSEDRWDLQLEKTDDIALQLGEIKKSGQWTVGFALETENEKRNAKKKLQAKQFDMIVLNSLNEKGAGFGTDTNKITLIHKNGETLEYPLQSKRKVAQDILNVIVSTLI